MGTDNYQATASAYDLYTAPYQDAQRDALTQALPHFLPDDGPILDIGAGSGAISEQVLLHLPEARVVALEPGCSSTSKTPNARPASSPTSNTAASQKPGQSTPRRCAGA
jgi:cyclopropane fatty-acyl-phospholipid synthase-like methyltransferase